MVSFVFSANQAGGNLRHKHKTVKFDDPLQSVYNLVNRLKRVEKLHRFKSQPYFF